MAQAERFDLVVIGCGPAGEKAAAQAAYFGKRVAIVDTLPVGLKYLPGTARLNGQKVEPVRGGNQLFFDIGTD
mgnify:CR=1 FL=1